LKQEVRELKSANKQPKPVVDDNDPYLDIKRKHENEIQKVKL